MHFEELVQDLIVCDDLGIKLNENGFGVTGSLCADFAVCWVLGRTPGVPDRGCNDSFRLAELRLGAPESPGSKQG